MKLSGQARWYLNGPWPVYEKPAIGHSKPEPKAMQELVDAGIANPLSKSLFGSYWTLTPLGYEILDKKTREK